MNIDMTCPRCKSADWQSNLKETHGTCNSCGLRFAHPNPPAHRPAPREFADRLTSAEAKISKQAGGKMSRHTYPWYTWPGRAVLIVGSLAASVVREWFPGKVSSGAGTCTRWEKRK